MFIIQSFGLKVVWPIINSGDGMKGQFNLYYYLIFFLVFVILVAILLMYAL